MTIKVRRAPRHRAPRHNVNSYAWIERGNGTPVQRCTLVDISNDGARLAVENVNEVPMRFNLLLSRFGHRRHLCEVIWARDDEIGVAFAARQTIDLNNAEAG